MYKFNRDGVVENVEEERWQWGVLYNDNSELRQFDASTETFHQFQEIDWKKGVKMFILLSGNKRIDVPVSADMQVFYYYKNIKPFYKDAFQKIFIFGWKSYKTGATSYHYILPDDRIIATDNDSIDLVNFQL
jgi:hypothetical protein